MKPLKTKEEIEELAFKILRSNKIGFVKSHFLKRELSNLYKQELEEKDKVIRELEEQNNKNKVAAKEMLFWISAICFDEEKYIQLNKNKAEWEKLLNG